MSVGKPVRTMLLLILCTGLLVACGDTPTPTPVAALPPTATAPPPAATPTTAVPTAPTATTGGGSTSSSNSLQNISQAMQQVTSYHFTMTTDIAGTGSTTVEGDVIPPDKMSMTSSVDVGGQKLDSQIIRIGAGTWTNVLGQWIKADLPAGTPNPTDLIATLGAASGAEDLGADPLDGKPAHHYRYAVSDPATGTASTEVWVDNVTGLIIQYRATTDAPTGKITVTMKLSKFNDPNIKIDPPQ